MSVLDKFLDVMRLTEEEVDDFYYDDDDYEVDDEPQVSRTPHKKRSSADYNETRSTKEKSKTNSKITPMRPVKKQGANGMEVCVIKPTIFNDTREIADTLLSNRAVILNVEGLDTGLAQRIIDFSAGSCYAISGNLQKISNYIFIITPASVDISGDFLDMLDSLDYPGINADA